MSEPAPVPPSAAGPAPRHRALEPGGWFGILVSPAGTALAVALGALVGLAYVGAFLYAGYRAYVLSAKAPGTVRYPTLPDADQSG